MGGDQVKTPTIRVRGMRIKTKLSPKEGKKAREKEEEQEQSEESIQPRVVHAAKE